MEGECTYSIEISEEERLFSTNEYYYRQYQQLALFFQELQGDCQQFESR